jgi:hypothetical protein
LSLTEPGVTRSLLATETRQSSGHDRAVFDLVTAQSAGYILGTRPVSLKGCAWSTIDEHLEGAWAGRASRDRTNYGDGHCDHHGTTQLRCLVGRSPHLERRYRDRTGARLSRRSPSAPGTGCLRSGVASSLGVRASGDLMRSGDRAEGSRWAPQVTRHTSYEWRHRLGSPGQTARSGPVSSRRRAA